MDDRRSDGTLRPRDRTDFHRALTPGATFESEEGQFLVREVPAGELVLPSGRIIATDPSYLSSPSDTPAFVRSVPPGAYSVWLVMARLANDEPWAERVACVVLQLSEAQPERWELALRPGEDPGTLALGRFFGHGVDSGNACFVDAAAIEGLDRATLDSLYMEQVVASYERDNWRSRSVVVPLPGSSPANLIACSSGYGDGAYPSWWGFDARGEVCALATDFFVLVEHLGGEARFPLREWADRTLVHPDLPLSGARVTLPPVPAGATNLSIIIEGGHSCEAKLVNGAGEPIHAQARVRVSGGRMERLLQAKEPLPDDAVLVLSYSLGVRGL